MVRVLMLSASATVAPKTTVTSLSARWALSAPPVAVVATKSSAPPSSTPSRSGRLRLGRCRELRCCCRRTRPRQRDDGKQAGEGLHGASVYGEAPVDLRATGYRPRRAGRRDRRKTRAVRTPDGAGRAEPPARPDARRQRPHRACAVRPRDRASGLRGRRVLRRRPLHRPARPPSPHRAGGGGQLGFSPPWLVKRLADTRRDRRRACAITGNPEPELFADLDGARVGKARMREVAEASLALTDGLCNWTIVAYPNAGWAETVFGEPDVERLWQAVARRSASTRPIRSRRGASTSVGSRRARALNAWRFAQLRYRGPGTDLTIGLHAESAWQAALGGARSRGSRSAALGPASGRR